VTNHGVPEPLVQDLFNIGHDFFRDTEEEKSKILMKYAGKDFRGYFKVTVMDNGCGDAVLNVILSLISTFFPELVLNVNVVSFFLSFSPYLSFFLSYFFSRISIKCERGFFLSFFLSISFFLYFFISFFLTFSLSFSLFDFYFFFQN
jgi:hypothetical protein